MRNSDGSGVVAGVTSLGLVHGYVLYEGEKRSDEGKLFYRGYGVEKLADGYVNENRYGFEECAFLLLFGLLPTSERLDTFDTARPIRSVLPANFTEDVAVRAPSANVMNKIAVERPSPLFLMTAIPKIWLLDNQLRQSPTAYRKAADNRCARVLM